MPLVKLFRRVRDHDRTRGRSPSKLRASCHGKTGGGGEGQVFFRMKIPFRRREKNITIEAEGKAGLYQAPGRFRSDWQ